VAVRVGRQAVDPPILLLCEVGTAAHVGG